MRLTDQGVEVKVTIELTMTELADLKEMLESYQLQNSGLATPYADLVKQVGDIYDKAHVWYRDRNV